MNPTDRQRNVSAVWGFAFAAVLLFVMCIYVDASEQVYKAGYIKEAPVSNGKFADVPCRKLLLIRTKDHNYGDGNVNSADFSNYTHGNGIGSIKRVGFGNDTTCSIDDIVIVQAQTSPLPNGIPTYTAQVENVCMSESDNCSISDIHLSCGWFSSAEDILPTLFRRIAYDDCLVNDGQPLNQGEVLTFKYANTFKYPLSVSSVACQS